MSRTRYSETFEEKNQLTNAADKLRHEIEVAQELLQSIENQAGPTNDLSTADRIRNNLPFDDGDMYRSVDGKYAENRNYKRKR